jgi:hypothetical protein
MLRPSDKPADCSLFYKLPAFDLSESATRAIFFVQIILSKNIYFQVLNSLGNECPPSRLEDRLHQKDGSYSKPIRENYNMTQF